jgi:hypothetical protein
MAIPVRFVVAVAALAWGCSGSDPDPEATFDARVVFDAVVRDPTMVWVAGSYATQVTLQESSCTGITVQNMATQVIHQAGESAVTLVHASIRHNGTVGRDGTFATEPRAVTAGGDTHTLTMAGQFSTTGFDAVVSAQVALGGGGTCSYAVRWIGSKGGEPNVIPG